MRTSTLRQARGSLPRARGPAAHVPGPVEGTRITEAYARLVAREAYFWAWPMVNMYNRRLAFAKVPARGRKGVLPVAPLGRLAMLRDRVATTQRWLACPDQDVVHGAGIAALDRGPVVVQVPDFGSRFWVYQVVDLRTDAFADLGAMYDTPPGMYLLVGPTWRGAVPAGIARVFRSPTSTAMVVPRVFQDDTAGDRRVVRRLLGGIDMYPLAEYDGATRRRDWSALPPLAPLAPSVDAAGGRETRWVFPETFFEQLPAVLDDAPPLPGEETRYSEVRGVLEAARRRPELTRSLVDEARSAERLLVAPLLQFRSFGIPLPHHWTTESNGAAFGSDYFMRTAIARSNILVNRAVETTCFYQDLDVGHRRLNGANRYTITFGRAQLPPVRGLWSISLYDEFHLPVPNALGRHALGTRSRDLASAADGSLTLYVQADEPDDAAERANWLPAPRDGDFSLYLRAHWPERAILERAWTPPPVLRR
jgi:hypothetical protein